MAAHTHEATSARRTHLRSFRDTRRTWATSDPLRLMRKRRVQHDIDHGGWHRMNTFRLRTVRAD